MSKSYIYGSKNNSIHGPDEPSEKRRTKQMIKNGVVVATGWMVGGKAVGYMKHANISTAPDVG